MKSPIGKKATGMIIMFIAVLGYMGYRYQKIEEQKAFINTIGVSLPIGELGVLNKVEMHSLYKEINVKSPSEIIRKGIVEYLYTKNNNGNIEQALFELDGAISSWDVESPTMLDYGKAVRLASLLREAGLVKEARNVLQAVLDEQVTNYAQGLDMVSQKLNSESVKAYQLDPRNLEAILSVVVLDNVLLGNSSEVSGLVQSAFKEADWDLYVRTGDYSQVYLWQLIGIYHPESYNKFLKDKLIKVFEKNGPAKQTGSLRYIEAKLLHDQ